MSTTPKGAIVQMSRYGATRLYADWISQQLNLPVYDAAADPIPLQDYDYLLIGSSVYMGKLLIKRWLLRHREGLKAKRLFFFIVCATPDTEREKQRQIRERNIHPELAKEAAVFFLPGRLVINRLSWSDRLFLRLGARLEKDPVKRAAMRQDLDGMNVSHLKPLIDSVKGRPVPAPNSGLPLKLAPKG